MELSFPSHHIKDVDRVAIAPVKHAARRREDLAIPPRNIRYARLAVSSAQA
jgi:hypothetical protein